MEAQVHNTPEGHVTRDYKEGTAALGHLTFRCVDTSGLEPFMDVASLQARATLLTQRVLANVDVALVLLDARCASCCICLLGVLAWTILLSKLIHVPALKFCFLAEGLVEGLSIDCTSQGNAWSWL